MYVPVHNMYIYIYTVDYSGLSLTKSQITESAGLEKEIYWLQWNYSCCIKKRSPLYIHVCVSMYTDMIFYFATGYLCAKQKFCDKLSFTRYASPLPQKGSRVGPSMTIYYSNYTIVTISPV